MPETELFSLKDCKKIARYCGIRLQFLYPSGRLAPKARELGLLQPLEFFSPVGPSEPP